MAHNWPDDLCNWRIRWHPTSNHRLPSNIDALECDLCSVPMDVWPVITVHIYPVIVTAMEDDHSATAGTWLKNVNSAFQPQINTQVMTASHLHHHIYILWSTSEPEINRQHCSYITTYNRWSVITTTVNMAEGTPEIGACGQQAEKRAILLIYNTRYWNQCGVNSNTGMWETKIVKKG
jgi:hypothetical protein